MSKGFIKNFIFLAILIVPTVAYADGIDMFWYFTHVPEGSIFQIIFSLFILMTINYFLNFIVIGLPLIRFYSLSLKDVSLKLLVLTLLGQLADRIGALLGAIPLLFFRYGTSSNTISIIFGIFTSIMNLLLPGIAVGFLVFYFLKYKWLIKGRGLWVIATAAGVLTNPAWVTWSPFLFPSFYSRLYSLVGYK